MARIKWQGFSTRHLTAGDLRKLGADDAERSYDFPHEEAIEVSDSIHQALLASGEPFKDVPNESLENSTEGLPPSSEADENKAQDVKASNEGENEDKNSGDVQTPPDPKTSKPSKSKS